MNKEQELMFFLGRLQGYIEQASHLSQEYNVEPMFELLADIEEFFHRGLHKLFVYNSGNVAMDRESWRKHNGRD